MTAQDKKQIIEAEKYLKITVNSIRIGKQKARKILGDERYWSAMTRAAFHWTAATTDNNGNEYYFDCRDYFRS